MIQEVIEAIKENRLLEAFTTGTAVTIGSIKSLNFDGQDYKVPIDKELNGGKFTMELFNDLSNI